MSKSMKTDAVARTAAAGRVRSSIVGDKNDSFGQAAGPFLARVAPISRNTKEQR